MIAASELILNPDGSVYHLNLKPGQIANEIIFVGDQNRVEKITKHFDSIEFSTQKREFKTQTGTYKGKRISVMGTGMGIPSIGIYSYELIHFYGEKNEHNDAINCNELYDLQSDPNELNNLYDNPEYADIQTRLQARLDKFRVDQKVDEY